MTIADSDVLIDFLSNVEPSASHVARELERGRLVTTAINRFELLSGARTERQERTIRELLAVLPTLPINEITADRSAEVRRKLESAGLAIGMADSLIAGVALSQGAVLLTRNRRHFDRVVGLKLADLPTQSGS